MALNKEVKTKIIKDFARMKKIQVLTSSNSNFNY